MDREPAEVPRSLTDGDQVGGYVIEARIGVGGFGEVYRARHPVIGREVAIKVLHRKYSADPEAVARFVAEARAVNQISHPKIVEVFDFGKLDDGREFCVMELIAGTTLRDVLRARTRLPLAEALPILRGIAEAVDAAHAAGIAHRDLKPDNVFVLADGGTKLIDFGLAKLTRELDAPVTQTGSVFGTPIYMSPEQCRGKATDARTDLYSFGVLAYQLLTGEPPFGGDALELALHHLNDPPMPPSRRCKELSRNADRVVLALLAKDPADRPASLVNATDALAGATTLRARRWKRHARWAAMIATPIALASLAVLWPSASASKEADCAPASERLAGIWDPKVEAAIATRFAAVNRSDTSATLRSVTTELDDTAHSWSAEWDRACHADEHDPLLHLQRLNCLENALLGFHGATASMASVDIALFADGWVGGFNTGIRAVDCARDEVVRAQPPAPRPEQRVEITELLVEVHRLRVELRAGLNTNQPERLEPALSRLEQIANRLDALGAPVAAEVSALHAHYLVAVARTGDLKQITPARQAIAIALRRAGPIRDDQSLAFAYVERALLEMSVASRDDAKIDEALDLAQAAYNRAGRPAMWFAAVLPDVVRADALAQRGNLEEAIALHPDDAVKPVLLARLGRHAEAIASARRQLDWVQRELGASHMRTAGADALLAHVLARSGDVEGALAEADRVVDVHRELHASAATLKSDRIWQLVYAMRLGRSELAAKAATAAVRGEAATDDGPLTAVEWAQLADVGIGLGAIEVARSALDREVDPAVKVNGGAEWTDTRAYVDFMIGDVTGMTAHARQVPPYPPNQTITQFRGAPWDLALADVAAGRRSAAEARLLELASLHYASDALAADGWFGRGWVLAALARWPEAKAMFEKVRAMPIWSRDWNLAEIDAWLGLAQLETHDPTAAAKSLDESLGILMECCDGFHYYAPMAQLALARALWQTNGNKVRARGLAEAARDGFARLSKFKEPERQQAIRWLAEHPAP